MTSLLVVNFKKLHPDAVHPTYAKSGDAGMDLTVLDMDQQSSWITYKTGIAVEIPEGYVGLLFPRSSVFKTGMTLSNCVGVIDSGYRGEIMAKFYYDGGSAPYEIGERFVQLIIMPYPKVQFVETYELSSSERGKGGYGSTGN